MYIIRKAKINDAESIFNLITPYADHEVILRRSLLDIEDSIDKFWVAVSDEIVIGTVSFYDYGLNLKEIRSLAVRPDFKGKKVGSELVMEVVNELKMNERIKVFALTYAPEFFKKNKFSEVQKKSLPEKIWKDCINCKNQNNCNETAVVFGQ